MKFAVPLKVRLLTRRTLPEGGGGGGGGACSQFQKDTSSNAWHQRSIQQNRRVRQLHNAAIVGVHMTQITALPAGKHAAIAGSLITSRPYAAVESVEAVYMVRTT